MWLIVLTAAGSVLKDFCTVGTPKMFWCLQNMIGHGKPCNSSLMGKRPCLSKAARLHRVTEDMIRKIAKKEDVDLRGFLKRNQAKIRAHSLDGQHTALKIVDGTCYKDDSGEDQVEATWCAELVKVFALPTSKLVIQRLAAFHVAGVFVKLIALRSKNVMQSFKLMNWRCSKNADLNVATQCVDDLSLHVIHIGFISNLFNSKRLVI